MTLCLEFWAFTYFLISLFGKVDSFCCVSFGFVGNVVIGCVFYMASVFLFFRVVLLLGVFLLWFFVVCIGVCGSVFFCLVPISFLVSFWVVSSLVIPNIGCFGWFWAEVVVFLFFFVVVIFCGWGFGGFRSYFSSFFIIDSILLTLGGFWLGGGGGSLSCLVVWVGFSIIS